MDPTNCSVKTGKPLGIDTLEPIRTAEAVKKMNLKHVVITSVDRDDLKDRGANHFSKVILESGANIAATMKYAAEEKSPGIFISQPISRFAFSIVI